MNVNCAGPHVDPVPLYTMTPAPGVTLPAAQRVLCADCAAVYRVALAEPETIEDEAGQEIPNPDHLPPGVIPHPRLVLRVNRRNVPEWEPPPNNYREPPGIQRAPK